MSQAFGGVPGAMHVDPEALVFTASWTVTLPMLAYLELRQLAVIVLDAQFTASAGCVVELAQSLLNNSEVPPLPAGDT